jgi:hypothetical protein
MILGCGEQANAPFQDSVPPDADVSGGILVSRIIAESLSEQAFLVGGVQNHEWSPAITDKFSTEVGWGLKDEPMRSPAGFHAATCLSFAEFERSLIKRRSFLDPDKT